MIVRWPGKVPAGKVENGIMSGLDWFPTFVAAAGNPNIVDELQAGQADRRHDLQGASRRLQPDGPDHRQGPVEAARDLLLHRRHARLRSASTTTSTASPTSPTAGSAAPSRSTGRSSSISGSIRSSAPGMPTARRRFATNTTIGSLYRVLALRVRAAGSAKLAQTCDRVPADAEGRELQPGSREGADRQGHRFAGRQVN